MHSPDRQDDQFGFHRLHLGAIRRGLFGTVLLSALALGGCGTETTTGDTSGGVDTAEEEDVDNEVSGSDTAVGVDVPTGDTVGGCNDPTTDCPDLKPGKCERVVCEESACKLAPALAGTACDDGKKCTSEDACDDQGVCDGKVTCADADTCKEAFCSEVGECDYKNVPAAQKRPCDDDNKCTDNDICGFGTCNGSPIQVAVTCDDNNSCTTDACDAKAGCTHTSKAKGESCEDGDKCTTGDACDDAGKCVAGIAVTCTPTGPNAQCQKGVCDKDNGCVFTDQPDGVTCNDGSSCTSPDECKKGVCGGEKIADAVPPNACVEITCDGTGATPKLTTKNAPNGVSCSDGDSCTQSDKCNNGVCKGTPTNCNDGNACTTDACDAATGVCKSTPVTDGAACDDGSKCSTKDTCIKGECKGEDYKVSGICDDGNPCTNDGCVPQSGCFSVAKNTGACDDGNKCTEADACVSGKCIGKDKLCNDNNPCTNDSCDKDTGNCQAKQFDGPCDDGNACTKSDTCVDGKCSGPQVDCDDKNSCSTDICDTVKGCQHLPKLGGTACDDGIGCTTNDKCDGGVCTGTNLCVACQSDTECTKFDDGNVCTGVLKCITTAKGKVCDVDAKTVITCPAAADPACGTAACDGNNGKCSVANKALGTPCNSANKCITQTACSADGKCVGTAVECDDGNPCTDDSCDPAKGCVHLAKADGTKCDDASECTPDETCKSGACIASKNLCGCSSDSECTKWDDGNLCNGVFACIANFCSKKPQSEVKCDPSKDACKDNICDPKTGSCAATPKKEGTSCNDGNECTIQEVCKSGLCKGNALDCVDSSACTIDVCDTVFGCFNAPVDDGGACDDGVLCTTSDKCKNGVCAGVKKPCDDDNPCTVDVCDSKTGKCAALLDNSLTCDDGNPCTTNDKCVDGVCKAAGVKCDDGNPCTIDGCDGKGGCKNILETNKDCDDGNACTVTDRCDSAGKCLGKAKDCDDGNPCTTESCTKGVCAVAPDVGKPCSDNNACTEKDACDNKGDCVASQVNCEDDNPCTKVAGPCSTVNGCTVVPDDGKSCNDGSLCTINDKCSGGACQGLKLPCDDGNICTNDSCDPKKGCVNEQNTCDDGNDCTFDKCDATKGCLSSALDGFQPCEDGDKCTEKGVCNGTKCQSKLVICDDKDPCTIDACTSDTGCSNLPNPSTETTCDDGNTCTDDHCDGEGKCVGVDKVCDDGNPCTQDVCDKIKGCTTNDLKDGTECDDGDYCSEKTICQGGICSGGNFDKCGACPTGDDKECAIFDDNDLCNGRFVCKKKKASDAGGLCYPQPEKIVCDTTSDTPCLKNICGPSLGVCKMTQLVNGSACSDGVPCTVGDTCQNGNCTSGGAADCSAVKDACNDAGCIEDVQAPKGFSCVPLPKAGTITCDADGSGCTANDTCSNGSCKAGKAVDCSAVAGECELAACVKDGPNGFTCKITPAKDGDACEDGQLCTTGDSCKVGKCQPGLGTYDCKDEVDSICAVPVCDKTVNGGFGGCIGKPQNEGKTCNADDNGCTINDICVQGFCAPGAPVNCTEKSGPCTVGACKSTGAAAFECVAAPVNESKPCEADNNGCTLDDHCDAGKCVPGKMKDCSALDGNAGCLVGTCESLSSSQAKCTGKPAKIGQPCNADSNGCTKDDACNADGACLTGAAVNCLAQSSTCATGACASTGNNTFQCGGDPKADGTKCDADGDGCTIDDTCTAGKCVPGKAADCSKDDKSVCVIGTCTNKGSAQYLCEPAPQKDGTPCDADKNGCTKNDACKLGFCEAGTLETCKDLQSLCADANCQDNGGTNFQCQVTKKESYLPLAKVTECDPAAKAGETGACPTNYLCTTADPADKVGTCTPKVLVSCTDGDACTDSDGCQDGKCIGYKDKDCDDQVDCTLDLCEKGTCKHQPIPGCGNCVSDDFTKVETTNWVAKQIEVYVDIQRSPSIAPDGSTVGALEFKWDGSKFKFDAADTSPFGVARYIHRRVYVDESIVPTVRFSMLSNMAAEECIEVFADEATSVWKACGKHQGINADVGEDVKISLAPFVGRWVDLEFRLAPSRKADAKGTIAIKNVTMAGACGPACLGVGMEAPADPLRLATVTLQNRLPQPWTRKASSAGYLAWNVTDKAARNGKASLVASYTGAPSSGKSETATLTIPGVNVTTGTKLSFALQAVDIGEAGCTNGDRIVVKVGADEVFQVCDTAADWKVHVVDLAPYVNKTVAITFQVESAKTAKAKGSFLLDDIMLMGACSYLCYEENFDSMGNQLTWMYGSSFKDGQVVPSPFTVKLDTTQKVSGTSSLLIQSPASPKVNDTAFIAPVLTDDTPWIYLGVAGATFVAQVNAFIDPELCLAGASDGAVQYSFALAGAANAAATQTTAFTAAGQICKSTSGWAKTALPMPFEDGANWLQPQLRARVTNTLKSAKVYIDDFQLICK